MKDHLQDVALATPTASVAGLTVYGVGLADWVYIITAVYTAILIVDKVHSILARRKAAKKE